MTVIAALKHDEEVWLVSDKLTSWGGFIRTDLVNGSKLAYFKHAIIGASGRSLFGNALRYCANEFPKMRNAELETEDDVFKFFYQFYDFIKKNYNLGSADSNDVSKLSHSQFLVTTRHKIFEVSSCRDIIQFDTFTAIGSGHDMIVGALHALSGVLKDPEEILGRAYQSCCHYMDNCGGDMELINVTRHLKATGKAVKTPAKKTAKAATAKKPARKRLAKK